MFMSEVASKFESRINNVKRPVARQERVIYFGEVTIWKPNK